VNTIARADYLRYVLGYDRNFFAPWLNSSNSVLMSIALNGQWNVSADRHHDYRYGGIAKRDKVQAVPGPVPGLSACRKPGPDGKFTSGQMAPPQNFETRRWEQFFNLVFQTDYARSPHASPDDAVRRDGIFVRAHGDLPDHRLPARHRDLRRDRGEPQLGRACFRPIRPSSGSPISRTARTEPSRANRPVP
jgi:hypothetical protein